MSYMVINDACQGYGPRKGLEGPFNFSGRVLYYDAFEGAYYDPRTDFYVSNEEMYAINTQFMESFKKACMA